MPPKNKSTKFPAKATGNLEVLLAASTLAKPIGSDRSNLLTFERAVPAYADPGLGMEIWGLCAQ